MALTLNNFVGFETGGLEEAESTSGSPLIQTTVVRTGTYALQCAVGGSDKFRVGAFDGGPSDAGDKYIVGFAFRTNDVTPSTGHNIVIAESSGGFRQMSLKLVATTGDLELRNNPDSVVGTATAPLTVDTWHYIEIYWENTTSGVAEVFIDDVQVISVSAIDFFGGDLFRYSFIGGVGSDGDDFFDDIYMQSGATAASDRLGSAAEVISYRSSKSSVTPDDGGGDLDVGTWLAAQTIPFSAGIGAEYTSAGAGAVDTDDVGGSAGTGGPNTDADITGAIHAIKAINRMERATGTATAHYILLGNDVDGTTRSSDLDPGTSAANFFFVSELATIMPLSTEFCRIGFEIDGAQAFECYDMLAQILVTPATFTQALAYTATGTLAITTANELVSTHIPNAVGTVALTQILFFGTAAGIKRFIRAGFVQINKWFGNFS